MNPVERWQAALEHQERLLLPVECPDCPHYGKFHYPECGILIIGGPNCKRNEARKRFEAEGKL